MFYEHYPKVRDLEGFGEGADQLKGQQLFSKPPHKLFISQLSHFQDVKTVLKGEERFHLCTRNFLKAQGS